MLWPAPHGFLSSSGDASYRYYRMYITETNGYWFTQVAELELRVDGVDQIPTMNAATTSGVTASALSTHSAGYAAWKTGDTSTSTFWDANRTQPSWLKYDFGAAGAFALGDYRVAAAVAPNNPFAPRDWTLQGSTDNSDWDTLDTVTGQTSWGAGEYRTFALD